MVVHVLLRRDGHPLIFSPRNLVQPRYRRVRQPQIQKRLHRLHRALQHRRVHPIKRYVPERSKKCRRLRVTRGVERRIYARALHDAAQVQVGLAVADEVEMLDGAKVVGAGLAPARTPRIRRPTARAGTRPAPTFARQ